MPYIWSFTCGVIAGGVMGGLTPIIMMAEMVGNNDYRAFVLVPIVPALLVAMFVSKAVGILHGALCGLAFSLPIGLTSFVISAFVSGYDSQDRHAGELLFVALATLGLSVLVLGLRAFLRDEPIPSPPSDDTAA